MEQLAPGATVRDHLYYEAEMRFIRALGSKPSFLHLSRDASHRLSVTVLRDACRSATNDQLCYIFGLLIGKLERGSIYHVISWSSHKIRGSVRSIGVSETLASGKTIDEGKSVAHTLFTIFAVRTHTSEHRNRL